MERFVTITEVFVACDYPRAAVIFPFLPLPPTENRFRNGIFLLKFIRPAGIFMRRRRERMGHGRGRSRAIKRITAVLREAWAKLRDWASVAGRGRLLLYSQAALPMPLSKPL